MVTPIRYLLQMDELVISCCLLPHLNPQKKLHNTQRGERNWFRKKAGNRAESRASSPGCSTSLLLVCRGLPNLSPVATFEHLQFASCLALTS